MDRVDKMFFFGYIPFIVMGIIVMVICYILSPSCECCGQHIFK